MVGVVSPANVGVVSPATADFHKVDFHKVDFQQRTFSRLLTAETTNMAENGRLYGFIIFIMPIVINTSVRSSAISPRYRAVLIKAVLIK